MRIIKLPFLAGVFCALLLTGCVRGTVHNHDEALKSGPQITEYRHPFVYGSNPIQYCADLAADKGIEKPAKVFILHIPHFILSQLDGGAVRCTSLSGGCVTYTSPTSTPSVDGDYDDDGSAGSAVPPTNTAFSKINWATPLDVDISNWAPKDNVVMLKIVLDDPTLNFYRPKVPDASDPRGWSYAIRAGDEGKDMFRCFTPPEAKVSGVRSFIRVRVVRNQSPTFFGGLNIGILIPIPGQTDPHGDPVYMPIYLDPMIHNNG